MIQHTVRSTRATTWIGAGVALASTPHVAGRLVVVEVDPEVGSLLGAVRHVARLVRRALVGNKRVVVTLRRPQNHPASRRLDLKCVRQ